MRSVRTLLIGGGVALLPFVLVAFFTWARTGRSAGIVALLGHGELLPAAAMLSAQVLVTGYGATAPLRRPSWSTGVTIAWSVVALSCAMYVVPFSGVVGYEGRLAGISAVLFACAVTAHLVTARSSGGGTP